MCHHPRKDSNLAHGAGLHVWIFTRSTALYPEENERRLLVVDDHPNENYYKKHFAAIKICSNSNLCLILQNVFQHKVIIQNTLLHSTVLKLKGSLIFSVIMHATPFPSSSPFGGERCMTALIKRLCSRLPKRLISYS